MPVKEIDCNDMTNKYWYVVDNLYKSCCYDKRSMLLREKLWDATIDGFLSATKKYNGIGHVPGFIYFCCRRRWWKKTYQPRWDFEYEKMFYLFSKDENKCNELESPSHIKEKYKSELEKFEEKDFFENKIKLIKNKKHKCILLHWLNNQSVRFIAKKLKCSTWLVNKVINDSIKIIKESEGIVS